MSLEESLHAVELLLDQVSAAVRAASPSVLEEHSSALRAATVTFAYAVQQHTRQGAAIPSELQSRMQAVGEKLVLHRESLARLTAMTDRQAAVLLPVSQAVTTYDRGLTKPMGQSGVARIYRASS